MFQFSYFLLSVKCFGTPGKEQCAWHNWVLFGYEKSMHADKSWQGDQSTVRPDQNHTPDTVVVYPDRLRKCGKTDFRQHPNAFFFKVDSIPLSVLSNQMCKIWSNLEVGLLYTFSTHSCFYPFFSILHIVFQGKKRTYFCLLIKVSLKFYSYYNKKAQM